MSFTLRQYQQENVTECAYAVAKHRRIINCIATGGGKSKIAITICQSALNKGKTVLFITESDKIYRQLDKEIPNTININSDTKLHYIAAGKCYLAMAQTLSRRPHLITQFLSIGGDLLIINDEAHIGTPTKLLLQLPAALMIGLTATPDMKWAKHLPDLYNGIVVGKQPEWLVQNGYLNPYSHAQKFPVGLDTLKVGNNGEYSDESQARVFDTPNSHDFLLADIREMQGKYRKCMIFCANIKSAESLTDCLRGSGYGTATQHSKYDVRTEAKQSYELGQFHSLSSGVDICISVASMNKGYDFPPIDWIIWWRATTSLPLYLQGCGRGSRLSPDTNKTQWRVTDWGGNGRRHGRWDLDRDWQNKWNKITKKKEGVAPIKECPKCKYLLPIIIRTCTNCGHEFINTKQPDHVHAVQTVMLEKKAIADTLHGRRLSQLNPTELAQWVKCGGKSSHAQRVAKAMEQTTAGYLNQFGKAIGYKQGWADYHLPQIGEERIDFFDKLIRASDLINQ